MDEKCTASRPGMICANGFVQKPFCDGHGACHACGHITDDAMPYCLRDELPAHFVDENGKPLFVPTP